MEFQSGTEGQGALSLNSRFKCHPKLTQKKVRTYFDLLELITHTGAFPKLHSISVSFIAFKLKLL